MNKEDKQFFIGLFKGFENRFDGIEGRFDILEAQVAKNYEAIQRNSDLILNNSNDIQSLKDEVHINGLKIEQLDDRIQLVAEGHSVLHSRVKRLEATLT